MHQDVKKILDRIIEILKGKYKPEKVIIFGSYVHGEFTRDSDIDLLIIKETDKERVDRFVDVKRLIYNPEVKIPVSPIVLTQRELEERINLGDDFIKGIIEKGVTLYER